MQNEYIFGNYTPYNTIIHKIDARLKIFFLIILMVAIFLSYGTFISTFIIDGIILLLIITTLIISKISFYSILKSLKFIWITLLFVFLINILLPHNDYSYKLFILENSTFTIYLESIFQSIRIFLRVFIMIMLTIILTSTTKSTDIAYALNWYMTPLKLFRFPVDDISMIISLMLRCIPLILNETTRIKKAQESRGANFTKGNIIKRIIMFTSIIVPLLMSAVSRSIEMADAMTIRGFIPSSKRTKYKVYKFSFLDLLSFILIVTVCCLLFTLAYFQFDILKELFNFSNGVTILR